MRWESKYINTSYGQSSGVGNEMTWEGKYTRYMLGRRREEKSRVNFARGIHPCVMGTVKLYMIHPTVSLYVSHCISHCL